MCFLVNGVEERVVTSCSHGDASFWVVHESLLNEVEALVIDIWSHGTDGKAGPLREGWVPVLKGCASRPSFFCGGAHQSEDLVDLIDFAVSWKHWSLCQDFDENGAHSPHINWWSVGGGPKENLRGSVP